MVYSIEYLLKNFHCLEAGGVTVLAQDLQSSDRSLLIRIGDRS